MLPAAAEFCSSPNGLSSFSALSSFPVADPVFHPSCVSFSLTFCPLLSLLPEDWIIWTMYWICKHLFHGILWDMWSCHIWNLYLAATVMWIIVCLLRLVAPDLYILLCGLLCAFPVLRVSVYHAMLCFSAPMCFWVLGLLTLCTLTVLRLCVLHFTY